MKRGKELQFKTKKRMESEKKKRFLVAFVLFFLLFTAASILFFLKTIDFDLKNFFDKPTEEAASEETIDLAFEAKGHANILVFCASSNKNEKDPIRFICLINADLDRKTIRVAPLSPFAAVEYEGKTASLTNHFAELGHKGLKGAVEGLTGLKINRFAYSDDTGFRKAMRVVDGASQFKIKVEEKVDYKGEGYSVFLTPGTITVNSDTLLKYLRYNSDRGEGGLKNQAQIIADMLSDFINGKTTSNGEATFEQLYNAMLQTDISGLDFHQVEPILKEMAVNKDFLKIYPEQDFTLFNGKGPN